MFLFILESFGTSEMLLVGLVALILLGPRRLPEMARKAGKIMSEFRGTANEFRETWQREVNFEEEAKAFDIKALEVDSVQPGGPVSDPETAKSPVAPSIKEVDPAIFDNPKGEWAGVSEPAAQPRPNIQNENANDKKNWL